ncbi:MAG: hypothetical protein LBB80_05485 [Treponema sp.]|nr:hypothetical protein [Treponema sp.]
MQQGRPPGSDFRRTLQRACRTLRLSCIAGEPAYRGFPLVCAVLPSRVVLGTEPSSAPFKGRAGPCGFHASPGNRLSGVSPWSAPCCPRLEAALQRGAFLGGFGRRSSPQGFLADILCLSAPVTEPAAPSLWGSLCYR